MAEYLERKLQWWMFCFSMSIEDHFMWKQAKKGLYLVSCFSFVIELQDYGMFYRKMSNYYQRKAQISTNLIED